VRVELDGVVVAESRSGWRVLETSQAPAFYLPPEALRWEHFVESPTRSFCEWKGQADYLDVVVGDHRVADAAWRYRDPVARFEPLRDHVAFYPQKLACFVDGERAEPMPGGFYGGWITADVVGPFKGGPGTLGW